VLLAQLADSEQEKDLSAPVNCEGFGRIRHFKMHRHEGWSVNPLPNIPAARALSKPPEELLRAQVFQIAACNWKCWYCFVDRDRTAADSRVSRFFTADELLDLYLLESERPYVIDLSGGQPGLVPEWLLWMASAVDRRGLKEETFLWSDDNLSTDYYWRYLSPEQRAYLANYRCCSRVGCFKGYDAASFSFNTRGSPAFFPLQFHILERYLDEDLDVYAYVTLTARPHAGVRDSINRFLDDLQRVHRNLPLRTVPLKIEPYTPNNRLLNNEQRNALAFQSEAHHAWTEELKNRFGRDQLACLICDVEMRR